VPRAPPGVHDTDERSRKWRPRSRKTRRLDRLTGIYGEGVRERVARRNLDVVRQSYEAWPWSLLDVIAEQRRFIDVETGVHRRPETGLRRSRGSRACRRRQRTLMQGDEMEPIEPGRFRIAGRAIGDRAPPAQAGRHGFLLIALGVAAGVVWSERRTPSAEKSASGTTKSMPGMPCPANTASISRSQAGE